MLTSFCRRTTVSEFYSGETYQVGNQRSKRSGENLESSRARSDEGIREQI